MFVSDILGVRFLWRMPQKVRQHYCLEVNYLYPVFKVISIWICHGAFRMTTKDSSTWTVTKLLCKHCIGLFCRHLHIFSRWWEGKNIFHAYILGKICVKMGQSRERCVKSHSFQLSSVNIFLGNYYIQYTDN